MDTKSGVTNINDLPSNENVKISIEESGKTVNMNEIFKEIQSNGNGGNIPSRDIPINTNNVTLDETSKPNYIPSHEDYIDEDEFETQEEIVDKKRRTENKKASIEVLYEELQIPILLCVIYFIFQLPVVNDMMAKYLTFTFDPDGGMNLSGLVLKSVLYGTLYYILTKVLTNMSD